MSRDRHARSVDRYELSLRTLLVQLPPAWLVREHESEFIRSYSVRPRATRLPDQGWKLHVSAARIEAEALCERVLPFLVDAQASFKAIRDLDSLFAINSGRASATQVGKILTIYGSRKYDLGALAKQLSSLWGNAKGPSVPSDLRVSGSNAVFLRYGAIAAQKVIADRLGRHAYALRRPDGVYVPDVRSLDGSQPSWASPPPIACDPPSEIDIDSRFRIAAEEFLPMVCLNSSTHGRTYLGISLKDGRSVVLKTARRGICWDVDGYDSVDLLYREYRTLRDLSLHRCLAPYPIGFVRGDDLAVLAMEDLKGEPLEAVDHDRLIALLPRLAESVAGLHASGYVHGDIKLSNAIAVNDAIRLVDFSLATPTGDRDIMGGTRNYMAPEGAEGPVAPAQDVFSLGVAIAHAYLGRDPATLPAPSSRLIGLLNMLDARTVSRLLERVLSGEPTMRPTPIDLTASLANLAARVDETPSNRASKRSRSTRTSLSSRIWCMRASQSAGMATRRFFEQKADIGWWRNAHFEAGFLCEGINLGAAGIILGLIALDHALGRNDFRSDVVHGCNWLAARPVSDEALGLLSGDAGVALALGVASRRYDCIDWLEAARARLENAVGVRRDYDFFSGAAGVLYAASVMSDLLEEEQWPRAVGSRMADRLVGAVQRTKGVLVWPASEEAEPPLTGAAHGCAGVALALAQWSRYSGDVGSQDLAVEVLLRLFDSGRLGTGGLARSIAESPAPTDDQQWCHGVAGYIWCILVGLGDEPLLREAIDWGADRFLSSSVLASPVFCHGLAGQLDLCASLGTIPRFRRRARERASQVAATLRLLMERRSGLSVWMSEEPEMITPDLWVGFLGPAVALASYARASDVSMFSPNWLVACSKSLADAS